MIIAASRIVTPVRTLSPGWVEIQAGKIVNLGAGDPPGLLVADRGDVVLTDLTLAPGFVDVHCHGGGGGMFQDGGEPARAAADAHLRYGTTSVIASVSTAEPVLMRHQVSALAALVDEGVIAGIHLEGPWLEPSQADAHPARFLTAPTPEDVGSLMMAGRGKIRMVTMAPELPGACAAIRQVRSFGAVAALGHSNATFAQTCEAVAAGATVATHLFHCMPPVHHREPGLVGTVLGDPTIVAELIPDGVHLHPEIVAMTHWAKPQAIMAVTDAIAAAAADDGDFRWGESLIEVTDGIPRDSRTGCLAGSTLTMNDAVRFLVEEARLSLSDAIRAATLTPSETLGLDKVGAIKPGYRANFVVMDEGFNVHRVMRDGQWQRLDRGRASHATAGRGRRNRRTA